MSLGLTLANLGLQFAGIATVLYMSARMTQYMLQLKERETQQAARNLLRAKLPARHDIDMDSLNLNAHEISVAMVSRCRMLLSVALYQCEGITHLISLFRL